MATIESIWPHPTPLTVIVLKWNRKTLIQPCKENSCPKLWQWIRDKTEASLKMQLLACLRITFISLWSTFWQLAIMSVSPPALWSSANTLLTYYHGHLYPRMVFGLTSELLPFLPVLSICLRHSHLSHVQLHLVIPLLLWSPSNFFICVTRLTLIVINIRQRLLQQNVVHRKCAIKCPLVYFKLDIENCIICYGHCS